MIPVVVISLAASAQRRALVKSRMDALGVPFTFFDAVDGRRLAADGIRKITSGRRSRLRTPLSPGEIGCLASHFAVLQTIARGPDPFVCVLEDDADPGSAATDFLDCMTLHRLPAFDVLRLDGPRCGRHLPIAKVGNVKVVAPYRPDAGATAQIYSREGAKKIARKLLPSEEPFDTRLYFACRISGLRLLDVAPSLARGSMIDTTIGERQTSLRGSRLGRLAYKYRTFRNFVLAWGPLAIAGCAWPADVGRR